MTRKASAIETAKPKRVTVRKVKYGEKKSIRLPVQMDKFYTDLAESLEMDWSEVVRGVLRQYQLRSKGDHSEIVMLGT